MPTATSMASLSEPLIELLLRLGRHGARLSATPHGVILETPTTAVRRTIAAATVAEAHAAGFLVSDGRPVKPPCLVLSAVGRATLRHVLMTDAAISKRLSPSHQSRSSHAHRRQQTLDAAIASSSRHRTRRSILEQLAARQDGRGKPLLGAAQLSAGERFAADYEKAGMQPRVTARWSADAIPERRRRGAPGAGVEIGEAASAAQARVRSALAALGGTLANVVHDVCGLERGLAAVEAERGWPRGAGRLMLAGALEQLANHYGLIVRARAASGEILQWGDGAHRPPRTASR